MLAKAPRKTEAIEDRWVDRNVVGRYVDKKIGRQTDKYTIV